MGTHHLASHEPLIPLLTSLTLAELKDVPTAEDVWCVFGRRTSDSEYLSEFGVATAPSQSVQTMVAIYTPGSDLTVISSVPTLKPTFDTFMAGPTGFPVTEISLLSAPLTGLASWIANAFSSLNELEQWGQDWDGAGALAFTTSTLDSAHETLEMISSFLRRNAVRTKPNLVPLDDGSIRFEWANGDKELFLTILERSIEMQRWHPVTAFDSEYQIIHLPNIERELEWLAA